MTSRRPNYVFAAPSTIRTGEWLICRSDGEVLGWIAAAAVGYEAERWTTGKEEAVVVSSQREALGFVLGMECPRPLEVVNAE